MNKLYPNEKIFIAGATGMVGGSIYRIMKKAGYGHKKNEGKIFIPNRKELNLLDTESVKNWFNLNKPSIVIIAAAKVGGIYANSTYPVDFLLENLKIQTNIIEASWQSGVKRLLFLGSSCIYPKYADQPIKEEDLLAGRLEPTNEWYAIAKISGIKLCQALRKQYNFDAISLMPTNLYGTGDNYHPLNGHVMAALIRKFCDAEKFSKKEVYCWGTGEVFREFMHVDDLGRGILFALENWHPNSPNAPKNNNNEPSTILNIGTGKDIKIKELAKLVAINSGFKGEIKWDKSKPDGTPKKLLNVERIKSMGWKPLINLEEGIRLTINEFKENYYKIQEGNKVRNI